MIKENRIDWSCELPLTPTGHIDSNRTGHSYIPCGIKPVPVISKNSDKFRELFEAYEVSKLILKPASNAETAFQLKRLSTHCPIVNRDFVDLQLMFDDYLEDLKDYPLDLIEKACAEHRNSPDKDCDFFPRPGKLKKHINKDYLERKKIHYRLSILYKIAIEPPKLPAPPSYNDLVKEAENRIECEKMMAKYHGNRSSQDFSTKAELIPKIINEKVKEHYLTEEQAKEFNQLFYQLSKKGLSK